MWLRLKVENETNIFETPKPQKIIKCANIFNKNAQNNNVKYNDFAEIISEAAIYNLSRAGNYIPQILLKRCFNGNEYVY